ncbi:MAG: CvpA family protein [Planctomycetes bacterium]|nr:CvpA family protein [Planctomycetota bacterium]
MSWFDIGALVVVLLAVWDGAKSGLAWALMELSVFVGSALIAGAVRPHAEAYVFKIANLPPQDLPWVTHLAVFALCACTLFGILTLIHPAARKWRFKNDRWFGGAVGLMNGVVASVVVCGMLLAPTEKGWVDELKPSMLLRAVAATADSPAEVLLPASALSRSSALLR